jgi:hypothetical protein
MTADVGHASSNFGCIGDLEILGYPIAAGDVLLGAEYSPSGYEALWCAALIAWAHHRPLRIVHVLRDVDWLLDPRPIDDLVAAGERRSHALLNDMTACARRIAPGIDLRAHGIRGSLYGVLMDESTTAGLLVLGSGQDRSQAQSQGEIAPSIGQWFLENAHCPVLTVDSAGQDGASRGPDRTIALRRSDGC